MKARRIKIHSKYRLRKWDQTTVPLIRLEGKWLEKLGFSEGREVQIQQQQNKLTITLESNKKAPNKS